MRKIGAILFLVISAAIARAQMTMVQSTNWASAPNTAAVTAGSTLYDGWVDVAGGTWSMGSGVLTGSTANPTGYAGSTPTVLVRPSGEAIQNEAVLLDLPTINTQAIWTENGAVIRYVSAGNYYLAQFSQTQVLLYSISSGSATLITTVNWTGMYTNGHTYEVFFSAQGSSPTILTCIITDTTSNTLMIATSHTDSTSALQSPGVGGIVTWQFNVSVSNTPVSESRTFNLGANTLLSGWVQPLPSTNSAINVAALPAIAGTSPYTYQWQRSTTSGSGFSNLSGKTSLLLSDTTAIAGTTYYYQCVTTDSASGTATSNQISGVIWSTPLVIGFIGDSITFQLPPAGGLVNPPTQMATYLAKIRHQQQVSVVNEAISGTYSNNWVSGSGDLNTAISAFNAAGVKYVMVMLGTNDGRDDVLNSSGTYSTNMTSCVNALVANGNTVILNYPPYAIPGALSNWSLASDALIQSYQTVLGSLVNGTTILQGDMLYYQYSAQHPGETYDGIHPNPLGVQSLALLWARAFDNALNPSLAPSSITTTTLTLP